MMHEVTTAGDYEIQEVTPLGEEGKETSGSYNAAKILDDIVRLHVKACGFEVNRNKFQFRRGPLERLQPTAFGSEIPAYKSFESKVVDRNHYMADQSHHGNQPIGFIEQAFLKNDGVYLDLVLWKRTLSESELAQLRAGTAHVSMEVEYTNPVKTANGVRTMADNSIVSFIGIAVLFDGIQPGDQTSGILATENAKLQDQGEDSTERTTYMTAEISAIPSNHSTGVTVENLTPEQIEQLQKELSDALARAEALEADKAALQTAKEAAEVTAQELEALCKERDEKLTELYAKENEYQALQAQLSAMREAAFSDNLGKCFDLSKLEDCDKAFARSLFSGCYGEADLQPYVALASQLCELAAAATDTVLSACKKEDANEGGEQSSQSPAATPPATPEQNAAEAAAVEAAAASPASEPAAPINTPEPAPSIAGKKPDEGFRFTLKHLR